VHAYMYRSLGTHTLSYGQVVSSCNLRMLSMRT
jgi:hypothetical protein